VQIVSVLSEKLLPSPVVRKTATDPPGRHSSATTKSTGDAVIDGVRDTLAALKAREYTESELANALAPLFARSAFDPDATTDSWPHFLYIVVKSRTILEDNIHYFRSNPQLRDDLLRGVVKDLLDLQRQAVPLFGPAFVADDYIARYIN